MSRYFALVPAAGSGARMGELNSKLRPKQYLELAGRPLLYHALVALCAVPQVERVFVVLAADDNTWQILDWSNFVPKLKVLRCGGASRADSVWNGLQAISDEAEETDWIMVHDAARPCLTRNHIHALIDEIGDDAVGGILATPLVDTLKRAGSDQRIEATIQRDRLWQAQTPQMFRYGLLKQALGLTRSVTDEANAVEALGLQPKLVACDMTNLKVTYPLDLQLAEWILQARKEQE